MKQTVTIEDAGACRKLMRVEVDAAEMAQQYREVTGEIRKLARIPGFRPGHAPQALIEKRFAREIQDEVQRKTLPESFRQAVAENKLRVVTLPEIRTIEFAANKPFVYEAKVEVAPEFDLPSYKGIRVKKRAVTVTDEEVEQSLESLREQRAEFVDVTGRGLAMEDLASIRYSAVCEGKPIRELVPQAQLPEEDKDFWLWMRADSFLPGFCEQLIGAAAGERRQVLVDFPPNHPDAPLAGRKATFFVEVRGIRQKRLPALDDAFARELRLESVAALRARIRQEIQGRKEEEARAEVRNQIIEHLLKSTQFDLPSQVVAEETRGVVQDVVRENILRGVSREQIESKKEEIFGFASRSAADRVKATFILERIAEEEKITVDPAEVQARIEQLANRYQIPPATFLARLEERGGQFEIEGQIRRAKTLEFLEANATLEPS